MAGPLKLTRTHRILVGLVVAGAVIIAGIGFSGSYAAVRALAERKGFGQFSAVFPIGIDAGICVLLALDLLLTWIRIPFPLLRQTAWLLTAATIAFNGAAAWPDPLGTGMHAVIPVLFVVAVEAARHAVGRIADITADKHMEGVRITRWLLSPLPTFLLWRRMKLWELRSYEQTIRLEQERLIYQARLRSRFGRAWRRKAPIESLMPLRLARYGVPLAETAPAGLAAAGIDPALLPPAPTATQAELEPAANARARSTATNGPATSVAVGNTPAAAGTRPAGRPGLPRPGQAEAAGERAPQQVNGTGTAPQAQQGSPDGSPWFVPHHAGYDGYDPSYDPDKQYEQWYAEQQQQFTAQQQLTNQQQQFANPQGFADQQQYANQQQFGNPQQFANPQHGDPQQYADQQLAAKQNGAPQDELAHPDGNPFRVPSGPGRTRPLGSNGVPLGAGSVPIPAPRPEFQPAQQPAQQSHGDPFAALDPSELSEAEEPHPSSQLPDDLTREEAYFNGFRKYVSEHMDFPNARQFGIYLQDLYGVMGQSGGPLTESTLRPYLRDFRTRYQRDLDAESAESAESSDYIA